MTTYEAVVTLGAFVVGAKILSMVAQSIITDLIMTMVLAYMCKMLAPNNKILNGEWEAKVKKNAEWCEKLVDVVKNPRPREQSPSIDPLPPCGCCAALLGRPCRCPPKLVRCSNAEEVTPLDTFRFATRALPEPPQPFVFPTIVPPQGGIVITEPEPDSDDEWYVGECPGCECGVECTSAHRDKYGDLHPNCCARGDGDEYLGGYAHPGVEENASSLPLAFASPEMATIATGKYSSYDEAYKKIVLKQD